VILNTYGCIFTSDARTTLDAYRQAFDGEASCPRRQTRQLPDMVTTAGARKSRCFAQCVDAYAEHGGNIIAGGEIQITDGMIKLAASQAFHGVRFAGQTHNCGSKLGFLTANIAFVLGRPDLTAEARAAIRKLVA